MSHSGFPVSTQYTHDQSHTACARPESHARVENKQRGTLWLVLLLPPTLPLHNGIHTHCQFLVLISKRSVPSHSVSRRPLEPAASPHQSFLQSTRPLQTPLQIIFRTVVQLYHGPQKCACTVLCMHVHERKQRTQAAAQAALLMPPHAATSIARSAKK